MKDGILEPGEIRPEVAPRPRRTVAHVELDGEGVLYDEETNQIHLLDPIGTLIWGGLDGRITLEKLSSELSAAFGAEVDRVRFDVLEAVRGFAEQKLLEDGSLPEPSVSEAAGEEEVQDGNGEPRFLTNPPSP